MLLNIQINGGSLLNTFIVNIQKMMIKKGEALVIKALIKKIELKIK